MKVGMHKQGGLKHPRDALTGPKTRKNEKACHGCAHQNTWHAEDTYQKSLNHVTTHPTPSSKCTTSAYIRIHGVIHHTTYGVTVSRPHPWYGPRPPLRSSNTQIDKFYSNRMPSVLTLYLFTDTCLQGAGASERMSRILHDTTNPRQNKYPLAYC